MPPIVLTALQILFLLLLYVFVARAIRAVVRDLSLSASAPRKAKAAAPLSGPPAPRKPQPVPAPVGASPSRRPQAAPASASKPPRLKPQEIVVHAPSGAPRVLPLGESEITFGRAGQCTVALDDPYASDRHARIYYDGGRWMVADSGSTNGTFLNQVKVIDPTPIAAGDQLGIGRTVVEVRK